MRPECGQEARKRERQAGEEMTTVDHGWSSNRGAVNVLSRRSGVAGVL
jgi:hypothetical protein